MMVMSGIDTADESPGGTGKTLMARFVLGVIALVLALWAALAIFRLVSSLLHFLMVAAIIVILIALVNGLRQRSTEGIE